MPKRKMVQCVSAVNSDMITRDTKNGIEHINIVSYTLPDDIVMNGGLYSKEEIDASYKTLERTLAPIEHPKNSDGEYISASDPEAIHNYHAGAFNVNVVKEGNRVKITKRINVQEAMRTDRGRRLLDRIEEIETNENARPIHTSVGVFLDIEEVSGVNSMNQEYNWKAKDMVFDHDAILLNSIGAAQPSQGVGMAINKSLEHVEVDVFYMENSVKSNAEGLSMEQKHKSVSDALERSKTPNDDRYIWIMDLFEDDNSVIYNIDGETYEVHYEMDEEGRATIVGLPLPVKRETTYTPKLNSQEGDAMKEKMLKALRDGGVAINESWTDDEIFEQYTALTANRNDGDNSSADDDKANLAEVVANAVKEVVKPIQEELNTVKAALTANDDNRKKDMAKVIVNSGKYPGLDEDSVMGMPEETIKKMAANCVPSYGGVVPVFNSDNSQESTVSSEMQD